MAYAGNILLLAGTNALTVTIEEMDFAQTGCAADTQNLHHDYKIHFDVCRRLDKLSCALLSGRSSRNEGNLHYESRNAHLLNARKPSSFV